jgi:hypothetical protein
MAKPEITASEADAAPEPPPPAPVQGTGQGTGQAKPASAPEVAAAPAGTPPRAKSEKALRLAQALRDNLKRRKAAARSARQSN